VSFLNSGKASAFRGQCMKMHAMLQLKFMADYGNFAKIINETGLAMAKGHENSSGFMCCEKVFEQFLVTIEEQLKDVEFNIDVIADIELRPEQINSNLVQQLTTLNRISGSGWAPIKILVRTDDYEVGTFSTQKHLKITDKSGMLIVKWNCDDWKTMSNNGEIIAVGTLSNPRYGRKSYVQLTVDEYTQQND
jgi:single-stranded DNA-specific DHH superfamily exonuclease